MSTTPTPQPDILPIQTLADALNDLGLHALSMESGDGTAHDDCLRCQTTIMLSRVVSFGEQLRAEARRS